MDRVRCHQLYGDGLGRMGRGGVGVGAKGGRKENGRENLSLYYVHFGVPFPTCSLPTLLTPVSMGPVA